MKIIGTAPAGMVDPLAFREQVIAILKHHFESEHVEFAADPRNMGIPALRFGQGYIIFKDVPAHRLEAIWTMINVIAPSIRTLEENISNTQDILHRLGEAEKLATVARLTQMLAHDVRKPFSILRMGLGMLAHAKDPASVKTVLARLLPEIDKAVSSVDGLIADVMEVGSPANHLVQEPVDPAILLETALTDIFRIYPKADISIRYALTHIHMVHVQALKAGRVFANIVGNAVQAMGQKGQIWVKTREIGEMVEFCIGNAGSTIAAEDLPRLFDAFFTRGKRSGTGLGLAIAQKVVTAHGGRIWCESGPLASVAATTASPLATAVGQVEFYFTLPIAAAHPAKAHPPLPTHSRMVAQSYAVEADPQHPSFDGPLPAPGEHALEAEVIAAQQQLGRPLRVMIVDDEAVYSDAIGTYLGRPEELARQLQISFASDASGAIERLSQAACDLVITDVDMGADSLDGFALVETLRADGVTALICVHSNRIVIADHKTAMQAGADAFLPKPMTRTQLLRLLVQAARAALPGSLDSR